ncbi:MAG TPA: polynucleotide adenylyltransferase PcnB [Candidatus Binataceae bacterium]|nr:polynucleotide adenylyltransferase PcnB [Candidatus Binataceae bacterium]
MEPRIIVRSEHPISRRDIDPNVLKILYRLGAGGHVAYLVGGSVRDLMLGRRPKDFDVATSAHPQQVRDLFRNSRLIGRRFRLVHVFFGPKNIEVATFRRHSEEVAAEGDPLIRADNTFGTPEEDAFRRDFTVNSLFYDPQTFNVIDYAGGADDLRARLIRTIGAPELRMREDPVRMMRAVRFAAKLGFEIEPGTRAAIEAHRADLAKSSVPRIVEETYRTLGQPAAARAAALMEELGLLEVLIPFLSHHLRRHPGELSDAPMLRNLAALGAMLDGGATDHALVLAAMTLEVARNPSAAGRDFDLLAELRARGFARGDTERMRLLHDAFENLAAPSRRTRRLMRRPYFAVAREFFEAMAPGYGIDHTAVARFIQDPDGFVARPAHDQPATPSNGSPRAGRRKRRRHGGRTRRRIGHPSADGAVTQAQDARESTGVDTADDSAPPAPHSEPRD